MILIMSASGALGSRVVHHLIDRGVSPDRIIAGTRSPKKLARGAATGVSVRLADYDDRDGMVEAFRGVETLILIPTKSPIVPRIQEMPVVGVTKDTNNIQCVA